ncbi:PREDICTED: mitotic spindle assembly checkpoint protein MAD1 [Ceratosolen solmsi marchali]|uniref:Mitotic spindle assembly checkpoint protein MAD1 n=1 Tax=Ceratosolen solmsi marchali TaxID=326594 RepID=A0AAJ7DZE5_9HYME|nr:PREDICTED: mitotic spindle assembly checkpoint protein MAD1 [Ceratosolen solmsi marchali]
MDEQNRTNINKTIKDSYQRSSSSNILSLQRDSVRRSSIASDNDETFLETPKRQKLDDSSNGTSSHNIAESVPGSPWEWRRMRGEIIALKTRLSHQEVQQLHKVRREIEEIFQKEKKILEIQVDQDKQMIKQLELRIDVGRRTIQDAKATQNQAERELIQVKSKLEQKILALLDDNNRLSEELRGYVRNEGKTDANESNKDSEDKVAELNEKLEASNNRISELEEKLKEARSVQQKYEVQCIEVQSLKVKLQNFESEKIGWEEGKKFAQRASQANEFERELYQAREIIKSLRESIKGKLLLEEQMSSMEHRLKHTENLEKEVSQLEIQRAELLSKITEYETIGITGGPIAIRREINRLQHAEALLTADEGQLRSRVESIQRELINYQQQCEDTKKSLTETTTSHERLTRFISRLQKKMSLDSYRQQLDTYEKEITGYQSGEVSNIISERIPALERAIESYRDLVAKLESDLEAVDGGGQREECKKLREEVERLRNEFEHRALKGDFNINSRILHFKMNPAAIAEQQAEEKRKALLEEVEQLRTIVASGSHTGIPTVSSLQMQELSELQQKHELKITRLKEAFKASSHEYRQACYQLFGWRVDRTKESQYKLSSQYAESPDDYLFFIVNEDGVNMIETPFSATLTTLIERHLQRQHSVPMFLNAVQSELFDQQTVLT